MSSLLYILATVQTAVKANNPTYSRTFEKLRNTPDRMWKLCMRSEAKSIDFCLMDPNSFQSIVNLHEDQYDRAVERLGTPTSETLTERQSATAWEEYAMSRVSLAHQLVFHFCRVNRLLDMSSKDTIIDSLKSFYGNVESPDFTASCIAKLLIEGEVRLRLLQFSIKTPFQKPNENCVKKVHAVIAPLLQKHARVNPGPIELQVDVEFNWTICPILRALNGAVDSAGHLFIVGSYINIFHPANYAMYDERFDQTAHLIATDLDPMHGKSNFQAGRNFSELYIILAKEHYQSVLINHKLRTLTFFCSNGGSRGCPANIVNKFAEYKYIEASLRIQRNRTCGPHALTAMLAYMVDYDGFRSRSNGQAMQTLYNAVSDPDIFVSDLFTKMLSLTDDSWHVGPSVSSSP